MAQSRGEVARLLADWLRSPKYGSVWHTTLAKMRKHFAALRNRRVAGSDTVHTLAKRMLAEAATANGDASLEQSIYGAGFAVTAALFEAALAGSFYFNLLCDLILHYINDTF